MILLAAEALKRIVDQAEQAYPEEACGLLVGHFDNDAIRVIEIHASANLAEDPRRAFEIDPGLRLRLQRDLRGGADGVIGLYHSHPDHRAQPTAADLARAWEPDLVWLITSVLGGQAVLTTAHRLVEDGTRFAPIPLRTDDWTGYARRDPMPPSGLD